MAALVALSARRLVGAAGVRTTISGNPSAGFPALATCSQLLRHDRLVENCRAEAERSAGGGRFKFDVEAVGQRTESAGAKQGEASRTVRCRARATVGERSVGFNISNSSDWSKVKRRILINFKSRRAPTQQVVLLRAGRHPTVRVALQVAQKSRQRVANLVAIFGNLFNSRRNWPAQARTSTACRELDSCSDCEKC